MLIISPHTVLNPLRLQASSLPKRFLGRGMPWPRQGGRALWARMIFEMELLRYTAALLPFVFAALIWQDKALAIAQAPLLTFMAVYAAEMKLLRIPVSARAGLISRVDAERGLDLFRTRARTILTRIAAGRGLQDGALRLVVEQSELARIAPLTFVSVQAEEKPALLPLTETEVALICDTLFQPPLDERALHRINLSEDTFLREERLEARAVSAHARLAAMMAGAAQ